MPKQNHQRAVICKGNGCSYSALREIAVRNPCRCCVGSEHSVTGSYREAAHSVEIGEEADWYSPCSA